jgi:DNA-directed RNA polymerase subunit RPC12/RpoP
MKVYRTELHGHIIEARSTDWGAEHVLVDGRIVSNKLLAGLWHTPHFFDINDEQGNPRLIEVRWLDVSKIGLGTYRVVINVDGQERCRLEPIDTSKPANVCAYCGYSLRGLPVENSEIRCPECGRHTSAILVQSRQESETKGGRR